jgi:hypothetical protein
MKYSSLQSRFRQNPQNVFFFYLQSVFLSLALDFMKHTDEIFNRIYSQNYFKIIDANQYYHSISGPKWLHETIDMILRCPNTIQSENYSVIQYYHFTSGTESVLRKGIIYTAGHSGRAVWGVSLSRLIAGIVGLNPA